MKSAEIKRIIKKLRVSNGCILVVKGNPADDSARVFVNEIVELLEKSTHLQDVLVVLVDDLDKIDTWDVRTMNKHGWFKRGQLMALIERHGIQKVKTAIGDVKEESVIEEGEPE